MKTKLYFKNKFLAFTRSIVISARFDIWILVLGILIVAGACSEEEKITDPIYEFVYFKGAQTVTVNEKTNSEKPFPVVAQLLAFKPYEEDIDLTLEVAGQNAEEDIDFSIQPKTTLKIKAGNLISDTLFISTVDNEAGTDLERLITIKIKSVSKSDIKIGLGLQEPKNGFVTIKILDDECGETTDIFNSGNIGNAISWGSGGTTTVIEGSVNGDNLTLKGDLIGYSSFSEATLTLTFITDTPGAVKGKATFGEQETGADEDGYEYKFVEVGEGSFDVCSGSITVKYDIHWLNGSSWVYWYSVTNTLSIQ